MRKISPLYIFIIGSIVIVLTTTLYYLLVPRFEYFAGSYTIYKPGSSVPDLLPKMYTVSNVYLVIKYGEYLMMYLGAFVLVYFIFSRVRRYETPARYVRLHLLLTMIAFFLLIYVNPYIILPQVIAGYQADVYVSGDVGESMLQGNKLILWYSSLRTPTTVAGILLCLIGVMIFLRGTFGRVEYRR